MTPERGWLTQEQQRIWRGYLLAKTRMDEYLDAALTDFGLSLDEYEILVRLSEAEHRTLRMGQLATSVRHSRSRLTHTIARMERRGLVRRAPCANDGRGVQAVLTDEGYSLLHTAAPAHVDSVREVFIDAVEPEDLRALGRAMAAVLDVTDARSSQR
nr:MarR family transcriptional regulator [uncultured Tessaracoccus sp.]